MLSSSNSLVIEMGYYGKGKGIGKVHPRIDHEGPGVE